MLPEVCLILADLGSTDPLILFGTRFWLVTARDGHPVVHPQNPTWAVDARLRCRGCILPRSSWNGLITPLKFSAGGLCKTEKNTDNNMARQQEQKDIWSADLYGEKVAPFVATSTDKILD